MELAGEEDQSINTSSETKPATPHPSHTSAPPPVMTVNKQEQREASPDAQDLLMQFDELTQDLQVKNCLKSSNLRHKIV